MRPSSEVPLSEEMAFSASSVVAISTKPKPRERPVSRSVITAADITSPKRAKAPRRPSLEVENERPPTNSFTDMTCSFRLPGRDYPEYSPRVWPLQRSSTHDAAHESGPPRQRSGKLTRGARPRGCDQRARVRGRRPAAASCPRRGRSACRAGGPRPERPGAGHLRQRQLRALAIGLPDAARALSRAARARPPARAPAAPARQRLRRLEDQAFGVLCHD